MTQATSGKLWQDEARSEQTKQLISDIKRITHRKFTAGQERAIAAVYSSESVISYLQVRTELRDVL